MLAIVGSLLVILSVLGGYMMAGGTLGVLVQPSEMVVIFGAAGGGLIISCPQKFLGALGRALKTVFSKPAYGEQTYVELLKLLYELFTNIRKQGLLSLEKDISEPDKSKVFQKYPSFMSNHHAMSFLADALSFWLSTNAKPHELDAYLETASDTHHEEQGVMPSIIQKVSDALPGFGIVAAVLGIVVTMQHLDGPPEMLGKHVAAALIGTFLGILLAYGFMSPIATNLELINKDEARYFNIIRTALVAFAEGSAPATAVELARNVILSVDRPAAATLNSELKKK